MGFNGHRVSGWMGRDIVSGPAIGRWVAGQIQGTYHAGDTAIGLVRDGEIIAGIIYENWNGRSIVAHMAITGRMTAAFVGVIFDYAFNVCKAEKAIVPCGSDNAKIIKLVTNMGFREEARIKDGEPNGDIVLYTLKRSECRFLGENFGKKYTSNARSA